MGDSIWEKREKVIQKLEMLGMICEINWRTCLRKDWDV